MIDIEEAHGVERGGAMGYSPHLISPDGAHGRSLGCVIVDGKIAGSLGKDVRADAVRTVAEEVCLMHALAVVERTGIDRLYRAADDAALHVLAEAEGILAEQLDGGQSHEFQTGAGEGVCADGTQRAGAGEVRQRAEIGAGVGIDKLDGIARSICFSAFAVENARSSSFSTPVRRIFSRYLQEWKA